MRLYGVRFEVPHPPLGPEEVVGSCPDPPGLYLHIPFCRTLCPFCPYNRVRYDEQLARGYVARLEWELDRYLDVLAGPVSSLYVGGGTPTLCLDALRPALERIRVSGERAVEVLPSHLRASGADRLVEAGFDYVSIGVQSFHAGVLRRLCRPTTVADNRAAVEASVGRFACVDVDLIFDVAWGQPEILLQDLRTCFQAGVDQVSTYPLMRFGYTPFGKEPHERRREHDWLARATEEAARHGYERRSVWTFARTGAPSYSSITRPYYLGLGAGAATYAGTLFAVNHFGIPQYLEAVDAGRLPVARMARLPRFAAAAYRTFWQAYTGSIPSPARDRLLEHPTSRLLAAGGRAAGWLQPAGAALRLTPVGYDRYHDLERWVTYHLIEPLWGEMMREHGEGEGVRRGVGGRRSVCPGLAPRRDSTVAECGSARALPMHL